MSRPGVLLPVVQNWSCHNCGGCCREHQIAISADEKRRIESQAWTATDGVPANRPLIVPLGSGWRLNHQDDGACVFLDDRGLCRIHAKFGEPAKPLACRTYPYAVHPAGTNVTVSLRFSCPSVVQNIGRPVTQQRHDIESLAREIVPADYRPGKPPALTSDKSLADWSQLSLITAWLQRGIGDESVSFATRLQRVLAWLSLLERAPQESLKPDQFGSLLKLLHETSVRAFPVDELPVVRPSRLGRLMFRQFVAQLLRHDTDATARSGLRGRLRLLTNGLRFTSGLGRVPTQDDPVSVRVAFGGSEAAGSGPSSSTVTAPRFSSLEAPFNGRRADVDALLTRFVLVKLEGQHFCGAAFYDMPVVDGFRSLALLTAAIHWVARSRAARRNDVAVALTDVQAALATLDHNYGYSPILGMQASRSRIRQLAKLDQVAVLCNWYSR